MYTIIRDDKTLKENLYLNIYISLIYRISKEDNKGVEILKQLGHEVKNWLDIETPSPNVLNNASKNNKQEA